MLIFLRIILNQIIALDKFKSFKQVGSKSDFFDVFLCHFCCIVLFCFQEKSQISWGNI